MVLEHDHRDVIDARFLTMGLRLTYGRHVDERDDFDSSPVTARVEDLHDAFVDQAVDAIITVIGGFNSNELLPHLDWDLIAANPKVLCGYSDITAPQSAILAKTGLVTYSGPHWATFGMRDHFEQTQRWFVDSVFNDSPVELHAAPLWNDDPWFLEENNREQIAGDGWWSLQKGNAEGRVVGTNLCTLNLLQGTGLMPPLDGALLALEDDAASDPVTFARDLTSLLQLPDAPGIRGLVIGRFQRASQMTRNLLEQIVANQPVLAGLPVLANADFGHTFPLATLPIGGTVALTVGDRSRLVVTRH